MFSAATVATNLWRSRHQSATAVTMWWYTDITHSNHTEKPGGFLKRAGERRQTFTGCGTIQGPAPLCVPYRAAHTTGESLISPAAADKTNQLLGESAANKLRTVSLCSDGIGSRERSMSNNINQQIIPHKMGNDCYTMQLHECTDETNHCILLGTSEACVW